MSNIHAKHRQFGLESKQATMTLSRFLRYSGVTLVHRARKPGIASAGRGLTFSGRPTQLHTTFAECCCGCCGLLEEQNQNKGNTGRLSKTINRAEQKTRSSLFNQHLLKGPHSAAGHGQTKKTFCPPSEFSGRLK